MAVSGWFVLLLALGVIPIVALDSPVALAAWVVLVLLLAAVDLIVAGSPRAVRVSRVLPARVRLGETVQSELLVTNTGARTIRGRLRDAWQPSAGAPGSRHRILIPAGERRAFVTPLTPFRRGSVFRKR